MVDVLCFPRSSSENPKTAFRDQRRDFKKEYCKSINTPAPSKPNPINRDGREHSVPPIERTPDPRHTASSKPTTNHTYHMDKIRQDGDLFSLLAETYVDRHSALTRAAAETQMPTNILRRTTSELIQRT